MRLESCDVFVCLCTVDVRYVLDYIPVPHSLEAMMLGYKAERMARKLRGTEASILHVRR